MLGRKLHPEDPGVFANSGHAVPAQNLGFVTLGVAKGQNEPIFAGIKLLEGRHNSVPVDNPYSTNP